MLAIVGESGSGKSVAMLAVMGLLPPHGATSPPTAWRSTARELLTMPRQARRRIAGKDIAMIFQEPMSSLNPCFTVGFQIGEALKTHLGLDRAPSARGRVVELLRRGRHSRSRAARAAPFRTSSRAA